MTVGYLANSFDLVNVAHLDLIDQARQYCGRLVLGVFSDEYVAERHGRPPVVPLSERMALVSHLEGVDAVVVHDVSTPVGGDDVRVFRVAGSGEVGGTDDWLLQPTRESSSPTLRKALRPGRRDDVA